MGIIKQKLLAGATHPLVTQSEYDKVEILKQACEALSRMCNKSVYVLDYAKQDFFYMSPHPLFLCGYTVEEALEMGVDFYEKTIAPENQEMMLELCRTGRQFFAEAVQDDNKGCDVIMSYDIYLQHKDGTKTLINHKLSPLCMTESGEMWLVICVVDYSSRKKAGNVVYSRNDKTEYYTYDFCKKQIFPYHPPKLTKREKEISLLTMRGYNVKMIAEELGISQNTVKNHRTHIEEKLSSSNLFDTITTFYSTLV